MKYHGGWSFFEAYNLPIQIRVWFVQRLAEQIEKENEEQEKANQESQRK